MRNSRNFWKKTENTLSLKARTEFWLKNLDISYCAHFHNTPHCPCHNRRISLFFLRHIFESEHYSICSHLNWHFTESAFQPYEDDIIQTLTADVGKVKKDEFILHTVSNKKNTSSCFWNLCFSCPSPEPFELQKSCLHLFTSFFEELSDKI